MKIILLLRLLIMRIKLFYCGCLFAFLLASKVTKGQNDAQLGHSTLWPNLNNPAALECYKAPLAGADLRIQWLGIEGQPFTQTVFAQMPIPSTKLFGGIVIANELAGAHQVLHTDFQFALPIMVKKQLVQIGASVGFIQYSLEGAKLRAADGVYTDNALLHNDPNLASNTLGRFVPNLNVGIKSTWNAFSLNVGIEHLYASKIKLIAPSGNALIQYTPLFHLGLNYNWPLQINDWQFKSAIWYKSNVSKAMLDWQTFATYQEKWRFGMIIRGFSPRNLDAAGALFGYILNERMQLNYSFEWPINSLSQVSYGTQELSLVYKLQEPPPPTRGKIIFSPRFL